MPTPLRPIERFSDRVDSYRLYRPHYPEAVVEWLTRECDLSDETKIADIAAGTGLLSQIFLANGNFVLAVEPNGPMREACAFLTARYPRLQLFDGTAEATGLPRESVDMVTVGQAMHWFDLARTRAEFVRILRPGGWCAVVYNHRRIDGDDFHAGYERILRTFGTDYQRVHEKHLHQEQLVRFFSPASMEQTILPNAQELTFDGLLGRVLSSSYMPQPDHPRYPAMLRELEELFAHCQRHGAVRMEYSCTVSCGSLGNSGAVRRFISDDD